jgi:hypothetical protein
LAASVVVEANVVAEVVVVTAVLVTVVVVAAGSGRVEMLDRVVVGPSTATEADSAWVDSAPAWCDAPVGLAGRGASRVVVGDGSSSVAGGFAVVGAVLEGGASAVVGLAVPEVEVDESCCWSVGLECASDDFSVDSELGGAFGWGSLPSAGFFGPGAVSEVE